MVNSYKEIYLIAQSQCFFLSFFLTFTNKIFMDKSRNIYVESIWLDVLILILPILLCSVLPALSRFLNEDMQWMMPLDGCNFFNFFTIFIFFDIFSCNFHQSVYKPEIWTRFTLGLGERRGGIQLLLCWSIIGGLRVGFFFSTEAGNTFSSRRSKFPIGSIGILPDANAHKLKLSYCWMWIGWIFSLSSSHFFAHPILFWLGLDFV
jgi:hypothetical protein